MGPLRTAVLVSNLLLLAIQLLEAQNQAEIRLHTHPEKIRIALSFPASSFKPALICSMKVGASPAWKGSSSLKTDERSANVSKSAPIKYPALILDTDEDEVGDLDI